MIISSCCGCECDIVPDGIVVTEAIGLGKLLILGDSDIHSGAHGGSSPCFDNSDFWSNVANWVGSGSTYAGYSDHTLYTRYPSVAPSVTWVDGFDLTDCQALHVGHRGDNCTPILVDASDWPGIKTWVEAGGVLIVSGEFVQATGGCGGTSTPNLNGLLLHLGSAAEILGFAIAPEPTCTASHPGVVNPCHELIDGTHGTVITAIYHAGANRVSGGDRVVDQAEEVPPDCEEINDEPYGILIFDGTLGGVAFRMCMALDTTTDPEGNWYGTAEIVLGCGTKDFGARIRCAKLDPMDTDSQWLIDLINETAGTTETYALDPTSTDPLSASVSETLANFCGSDAIVGNVAACTDPPFADCCTSDDDRAALCCLADDATIAAQGSIVGSCSEPGCVTSLESWGWNFGNPTTSTGNLWGGNRYYWHGPLGFDDAFGTISFYEGILSCNAGTWVAEAVDIATGDLFDTGTLEPGFTGCPTPSGTVAWGFATDNCCAGGGGTFKTTF